MGGSASKKSNFPGISLSQELIDKIYNNFNEFSKLKNGKSGEYISEKGLQFLLKPNKEFGKKVHAFLADQSLTQTLNFDVFLYFVEFFSQTQSYLRSDVRYREYSILEMFTLLSLYSSQLKNKQTDKEFIQRQNVSFRQGLEFMKELHGIIGALSGKKGKEDRDETIPKRITNIIFGQQYDLTFRNFVEKTQATIPNLEKIIQQYFKKLFITNEKEKEATPTNSLQSEAPQELFSQVFSHNVASNLSLFINQFSDQSEYRQRIYNGTTQKFNYQEFGNAISQGNNFNVLLLVSHLVDRQPLDDEKDVIQKTLDRTLNQKESHVIGLFLPKKQIENASFFQIDPEFSIVRNNGRKNFFNIDDSAAVVFFGEEEEDILFLHNQLEKESYIKTNNPIFSTYGYQPHELKIDQIEVWILSDSPIETKTIRGESQQSSQVITRTETVTPGEQTSIVSSQRSYYVVNQTAYSQQQSQVY